MKLRRVIVVSSSSEVPRGAFCGEGDSFLEYTPELRSWICCAHVVIVDIDFPINRMIVEAVAEARCCAVQVQWISVREPWSEAWHEHWLEGELTITISGGKVDT